MKVLPISTNSYRPVSFKASAGGTMPPPNYRMNNNPDKNEHKGCRGCLNLLGNVIYGGIIVNTLILMPLAKKRVDDAYNEKIQQEIAMNKDYYEAKDSLHQQNRTSGAFYQLGQLHDIDNATILKIKPNEYQTVFTLDDKKICAQFNINSKDKNTLTGVMIVQNADDNDSTLWVNDYTIKFSEKNANDCTLKMKSRKDSTDTKEIALQRIGTDLYLLKDGERVQLNKTNVAKFEEKKAQEDLSFEMYETARNRQQTYTLIAMILTLLKILGHSNRKHSNEV